MTRQLTNKQKTMLDKLIEKRPNACCHQDLPKEEIQKIADLTDNELVWMQMTRYISDSLFERRMADTSNPFMRSNYG